MSVYIMLCILDVDWCGEGNSLAEADSSVVSSSTENARFKDDPFITKSKHDPSIIKSKQEPSMTKSNSKTNLKNS